MSTVVKFVYFKRVMLAVVFHENTVIYLKMVVLFKCVLSYVRIIQNYVLHSLGVKDSFSTNFVVLN